MMKKSRDPAKAWSHPVPSPKWLYQILLLASTKHTLMSKTSWSDKFKSKSKSKLKSVTYQPTKLKKSPSKTIAMMISCSYLPAKGHFFCYNIFLFVSMQNSNLIRLEMFSICSTKVHLMRWMANTVHGWQGKCLTDMHLFWLLKLVWRNNGEGGREYSHSRTKC